MSKGFFQQTTCLDMKHRPIFCDLVDPSFQVSFLDFSDKNDAARSTFPVIDRKILFIVFNEKVLRIISNTFVNNIALWVNKNTNL